jgi:hypothetical protein
MLEDDEGYTDEADDGELSGHAEPAPIEKFHRTPVGMVFAAGLLGLREALETPKDEDPPYVQDWAGKPEHDDPMLVQLDPDNPCESVVRLRPWLKKETSD